MMTASPFSTNRMPNGLWLLLDSAPHQANGMLGTDKPKQELAKCLHAALGSQAPSALLRAIRSTHLTTFPGLTTNLISKHLPKSLATVLGHQDQEKPSICARPKSLLQLLCPSRKILTWNHC
jgi:hypothetical protein